MKKCEIFIMVFLAIFIGWAGTVFAAQTTLSWNPNTESDLAGYKLHYGTVSGNYTVHLDVHNVTTYTVTGLTEGQAYYFAASAYDTDGNESGYSPEVSYLVPGDNPIPPGSEQSDDVVLDVVNGIIFGDVTEIKSSVGSYFWTSPSFYVPAGKMIRFNLATLGSGPASVVAIDATTGLIIREYAAFLTIDGGSYTFNIPVPTNRSYRIKICYGYNIGEYQFQPDIELVDALFPAPDQVFVRQLKAPTSGGKYRLEVMHTLMADSTGFEIKAFSTLKNAMEDTNPVAIPFISTAPNLSECEITTAQYGGLYIVVRALYGLNKSPKIIISHLPGNVINNAGTSLDELFGDTMVRQNDFDYVYSRRLYVPVPAASDQPANSTQLSNTYQSQILLITAQDAAIPSLQKIAMAKLKIF